MPTFSRQPYRTVITHRLRAEVAAKLASHTYVLLNREDRMKLIALKRLNERDRIELETVCKGNMFEIHQNSFFLRPQNIGFFYDFFR